MAPPSTDPLRQHELRAAGILGSQTKCPSPVQWQGSLGPKRAPSQPRTQPAWLCASRNETRTNLLPRNATDRHDALSQSQGSKRTPLACTNRASGWRSLSPHRSCAERLRSRNRAATQPRTVSSRTQSNARTLRKRWEAVSQATSQRPSARQSPSRGRTTDKFEPTVPCSPQAGLLPRAYPKSDECASKLRRPDWPRPLARKATPTGGPRRCGAWVQGEETALFLCWSRRGIKRASKRHRRSGWPKSGPKIGRPVPQPGPRGGHEAVASRADKGARPPPRRRGARARARAPFWRGAPPTRRRSSSPAPRHPGLGARGTAATSNARALPQTGELAASYWPPTSDLLPLGA